MGKNREECVLKAVKGLRESRFGTDGVTGIKVELEAQLNRGSSSSDGNCGECHNGQIYCGDCNGDYDSTCDNCDEGNVRCELCYEGYVDIPIEGSEETQRECCDDCGGDGYLVCDVETCDEGNLWCPSCESGYVECPDCADSNDTNWGSTKQCHDWLLERVEQYGLSERIPEGETSEWSFKYRAKGALVFSKFYNDGSVDSEWTFTLSIEHDPEVVLLLPKLVTLFKDMALEMGSTVNVEGAGMHLALVSAPNAFYDRYMAISDNSRIRFINYRRSMNLLLPALYFLATTNEKSRGLRYRPPKVEMDKYSAINFNGNECLEFRIFDTCYEQPEQILDNIVVMKNSLRYWTKKYKPAPVSKITEICDFGVDMNNELTRFYKCEQHIDLLNKGLQVLKPHYLSVTEIKKQRQFDVTKSKLRKQEKETKLEITKQYKEYEQRFEWSVLLDKHRELYTRIDDRHRNSVGGVVDMDSELALIEVEAEKNAIRRKSEKKSSDKFVTDEYNNRQQQYKGKYRLAST